MVLKSLFVSMMALLLLVAPATFGSQKAPKSAVPQGNDLVVSSLFGEKLDPAVHFPAGSHPQRIYYEDHIGKSGGSNEVMVIYYVTSSWKIDDIIAFYRARFPGQTKNSVPSNGTWSIGTGQGFSTHLMFIVSDPGSSPSKSNSSSRIILCYVNLPAASVDRTKSANNGSLVFPIPQ